MTNPKPCVKKLIHDFCNKFWVAWARFRPGRGDRQTDKRMDIWTNGQEFPLCSTGLCPIRGRCPKGHLQTPRAPLRLPKLPIRPPGAGPEPRELPQTPKASLRVLGPPHTLGFPSYPMGPPLTSRAHREWLGTALWRDHQVKSDIPLSFSLVWNIS